MKSPRFYSVNCCCKVSCSLYVEPLFSTTKLDGLGREDTTFSLEVYFISLYLAEMLTTLDIICTNGVLYNGVSLKIISVKATLEI